ncbi:MAG: phosphatidylserine/phosphatidylglycerophosphate/cardiolipin synthase family protein [Caenispirillum sp.]|nr:phosphatidylserine/phosphatidylglycerophosphate/cardiolipin synthase family protein [Caenispirillum sp.]
MPPEAPGTSWQLFHCNDEIWEAVVSDCAAAQTSIDLEQYIFEPGGIGSRLLDVLAERARRGVRVRLLCDAFGSSALMDSAPLHRLLAAGGEAQFYNRPMATQLAHVPPRIHRDHRKSIVLDGRIGWLGGTCFAERMAGWRDTMVRFQGPPVDSAAVVFDTAWTRATQQKSHHGQRKQPPENPPPEKPGEYRYLINSPERPRNRVLYQSLRAQVRRAATRIRFVTPYFAPDRGFMKDLQAALARGVHLDLVLPGVSDYPAFDVVSHSFGSRLAGHGARVWFYRSATLHAKLVTMDEGWAAVGSMNVDRLSFRINLENALVSTDAAFIRAVDDQIDRDIAQSSETRPHLPRWSPMAEPLVRLASHL